MATENRFKENVHMFSLFQGLKDGSNRTRTKSFTKLSWVNDDFSLKTSFQKSSFQEERFWN